MPAISIFGKEDYGPDEIVALDELFERYLGVQLEFDDAEDGTTGNSRTIHG